MLLHVTVTNTLAGAISGTATVQQNTNTTSNITFTGSGGTGPYTFTYNVRANGGAAGSNQTITTTNTSVTTVPQSNAVNGQYIYTLVSVTDVYGCTGTIPTDNKDTITIVTIRWQLLTLHRQWILINWHWHQVHLLTL
jgi:predicted secreted Zn-dependent protease